MISFLGGIKVENRERIPPLKMTAKNQRRETSMRFGFLLGLIGFCLLVLADSVWAQQPPARVVVMPVFEKEVAPTTSLLGYVDFDTTAGISSEISGLIARQNALEGSVVRKGDLLVQLNTDFLEKDMAIIAKEIDQVELQITNTRKNLKRLETLFQQNVTTEKDYEDLLYQLKELVTQQDALRLKYAKKDLELSKSEIRAPFDGMVMELYKNPGEWISPGVSVCELAALDRVVVEVALSEDLIRYIQVGQSLSLTLNALERELTGQVKALVPKVDAKSKTFFIKIKIPYQDNLLQNMTATVSVPTGAQRQLVMVKRDALVRFQGKEFVYTVKDGKAEMIPIQVVAVNGEYMGVAASQIAAGTKVVVDGNERLQPGQAVQVVDRPDGSTKGSRKNKFTFYAS
jgi:RND family efflux transporter MFP subunit